MPFAIGQVIHNRYRIDILLGEGGMGAVYRAWDMNLDIPAALKEMVPDPNADPHTLAQLRQQFKREAQVVASLDHLNLVRVIDYFTWGGSECLVMNFVEGESLAERIEREGTQPEAQVLEWARQLLDALTYCHARGVIHRDVKPQNVIITPEGRTVLVDFGLVKLWDPRDPRTQTVVRAMGTPEYAPPEQYSATAGHTDPRSDLYSLGATLYHTLTGQAPMSATDRMAMPEQFVSPRALAPYVSPQTEAAVVRAMELPITQRFSSAQEMADALRGSLPVHPPIVAPAKPARRHTGLPAWAWGLGGAVLLLGCLVGIGIFWRALQGGDETSVPHTPVVVQDTSPPERTPTPWVVVATPTPGPTSTPIPPTATQVSPKPDPRVLAREVVERFQDARATAYSTWDTGPYYDVLAGGALESALQTITDLRKADCRYYVGDDSEMRFRYEEVSTDHIVVIASRSETQRRVCSGSTSYTCYVFEGRYVIERRGDQWYITDKSVQNLTETSPCP
jgi:serine/threonine protein kinase